MKHHCGHVQFIKQTIETDAEIPDCLKPFQSILQSVNGRTGDAEKSKEWCHCLSKKKIPFELNSTLSKVLSEAVEIHFKMENGTAKLLPDPITQCPKCGTETSDDDLEVERKSRIILSNSIIESQGMTGITD